MSVRLRKDGRWQIDIVVWQGGKRVRVKRSAHAKNKQEALAVERKERARLEAGGTTEKAPIFSEFAVDFLDTYVEVNNKPSEVAAKRMILRKHLSPFFGAMRLDEIGELPIARFKAHQVAAHLGAKSINNHLTCLRRMLAVAVRWKRLDAVPTFSWMPKRQPEIVFFGFDEADRLVASADAAWQPMVVVGLHTGLRRGELMALRWEDVDLAAGRIVVRRSIVNGVVETPKNRRTREVPLSDSALSALRGLPSRFRRELVFPAPSGRPFTPSEVWTGLHRATRKAGLRTVGWHALRHTFASHLVMRGVPLKAVQELLGHQTIEMTMRYAHLSPSVTRDAVRLLDRGERSGNDPVAVQR